MLTYLFTIVMGLIFGILQMKTAEEYWTDEYLQYALMKERELKLSANPGLQEENVDKVIIPEKAEGESNPPATAIARPCSQSNQEENNK